MRVKSIKLKQLYCNLDISLFRVVKALLVLPRLCNGEYEQSKSQ